MSVQITKWFVVTDNREYLINEAEKDGILQADIRGARFIQIDKAVINIAHIKEIYRKIEFADSLAEVSGSDMKYLATDNKNKLVGGNGALLN